MPRHKQEAPPLPVDFCAALLGCTERQVRKMAEEGTLVKVGVSLISPTSLLDEVSRRRGGAAEGEEDFEAARRRKMVADANAAEIATAREAGELVLASEMAQAFGTAIEVVAQKLDQIGPATGAAVILCTRAQDAAEVISKEVRAAREELASLDIADIIKRSRKADKTEQEQDE